jgi:hypothetical protein
VLGVEDRQEGDRHQRRRDEPGAALEPARAGPVDEADDERADHGDGDARGQEGGLRVGGEVAHEAGAAAEREPGREAQPEDDQQQVGQRGRVLVVARVEPVGEHRDRARDEVLGLVGVVGVRQAVVDVPEPQQQRAEQDRGEQRQRRPAPERRGRGTVGPAHAAGARGP